jgi:ATP-dependent Clp protease protease subunit
MEITNRNILLTGVVNEEAVSLIGERILECNNEDLKQEMQIKNYKREAIKLYINTNGGSVLDGFAIIDLIEASETPVVTINIGKCYSMGLLLLLSGTIRFASENSSAMMHDISTMVGGTAEDIFEQTENLKDVQEQVFNYIKSKSKIPAKVFTESRKNKKDIYFTLKQMLDYKIVDHKLEGLPC